MDNNSTKVRVCVVSELEWTRALSCHIHPSRVSSRNFCLKGVGGVGWGGGGGGLKMYIRE